MKTGNKIIVLVAIICVAVASFGGGYIFSQPNTTVDIPSEEKQTVTVQDTADRYVEVPYPVETIVVLWTTPTEELKALGAIDRIVGIDANSKANVDKGLYPELENVAVVGSYDEPNYEAIAELDPDVVIMLSSYAPYPDEVQEQLDPFGIAVVALDFYRTEVFYRELRTLGFMLDLETETEDYIAFFQDKVDMINERIADLTDENKKTVYFEAAADYMSYGGADYGCGIPLMITSLGGRYIYPELSPYTFEIDPEDLAQRNPDVIIKLHNDGYFLTNTTEFETTYNAMVSRPELQSTTAVTTDNVYVISVDVTGGARKLIGAMFIPKLLYPELFEDFDPMQLLQDYMETYLDRPWQGEYLYPAIN
ncbi:MAG: ABC transporter substrate-binding protein [Candidatus Bathyarchaeota archaeon]|nr:ABC transporter substrate-binding protein [Candidatus Bathyarchaeum sp.]